MTLPGEPGEERLRGELGVHGVLVSASDSPLVLQDITTDGSVCQVGMG